MEEVKAWSGIVATFLSIGGLIYTWITAQGRANEEKLDKHGTALVDHDRRIQDLEGELRHLPSKDDLTELKLALSQLDGRLGRIEESGQGTSRAVRRIEEYLHKERN